jgi:hypothetical protein
MSSTSKTEYDLMVNLMNTYLLYYRKQNEIKEPISWFTPIHSQKLNEGYKNAHSEYKNTIKWTGEPTLKEERKKALNINKFYDLLIDDQSVQSSSTLFGILLHLSKTYKLSSNWKIVESI